MLNPAFCGFLLLKAVHEFVEEDPGGLPFSLAALVLPVVLHKRTRELLPRAASNPMNTWLAQNASVKIGFVGRARFLVPFFLEAVVFATAAQTLRVTADGRLVPGPTAVRGEKRLADRSHDFRDCVQKARLMGRWFGRLRSESTAYVLWGIRP